MRVARWPAGWGHVPAVSAWQVREAKGIMTCARVLEKGHRQASLPRPWKEWRNVTRKRPKRPHPNGLDESYCNWLGEESVGGSPHTVLQHGPETPGRARRAGTFLVGGAFACRGRGKPRRARFC